MQILGKPCKPRRAALNCRRVGLAVLLLFSVATASISQSVPRLISYQGQLTNAGGTPVSGSVVFTFSLYAAPTGGTALWTENQTIAVASGVFNVQLGAASPLPATVFASEPLYLGIKAGSDAEMSPRQRLTSAAFAQRAQLLSVLPIGVVFAWCKSIPGVPALPDGWVECNGQVLADSDSPLNGQAIPDLNGATGAKRFLRGSTSSGASGGSETHQHTLQLSQSNAGSGSGWNLPRVSTADASSSLPSYYEVVWIMRVR